MADLGQFIATILIVFGIAGFLTTLAGWIGGDK